MRRPRSYSPFLLVSFAIAMFLPLALPVPVVMAQSCGGVVPDPDTDGDGTPDCLDQCPLDEEKVVPDECGCTQIALDINDDGISECLDPCTVNPELPFGGLCECPLFDQLRLLIPGLAALPCEDRPALNRNTVIRQPPGVVITRQPDGQTAVALMFQKFSFAVSITRRPRALPVQTLIIPDAVRSRVITQRYKVRYEATIEPIEPRGALIRKTSKRNQLTVSGLGAGSYSVKYRAAAVSDGDVVFRTKFSPTATFQVP